MKHYLFSYFDLNDFCCLAEGILMIYYFHLTFMDFQIKKRNYNHYFYCKNFLSEYFFLPKMYFIVCFSFLGFHFLVNLSHLELSCKSLIDFNFLTLIFAFLFIGILYQAIKILDSYF